MSSKKYDIASVNEVLGHSYLAFLHTEEIIQEIQKKIKNAFPPDPFFLHLNATALATFYMN